MRCMKRIGAVVVALAFAARLQAGITYRFESVSEGTKTQTFSGVAKIEGGQSRVDINRSDEKFFPSGAAILSSNTSSVLTVLNPAKKTYYELDFEHLGETAAETQKELSKFMSVGEPKVDVKKEGPGGLMEGYPTQRYRSNASIEIRINTPGSHMVNRMEMTSEVWTTEKIPADAGKQLQMPFHSGIEGIDKLMSATHSRISGFPLKEVTTTRMTLNGTTTTSTRRSSVTNIRRATLGATEFAVPAGFTKVDSPIDEMLKKAGMR